MTTITLYSSPSRSAFRSLTAFLDRWKVTYSPSPSTFTVTVSADDVSPILLSARCIAAAD